MATKQEKAKTQTEREERLRETLRGKLIISDDPENVFHVNQNITPAT